MATANKRNTAPQLDLKNIQGNILKPHGRNNVLLVFLQFSDGAEGVKDWLHYLLKKVGITTAQDQVIESKKRRKYQGYDGGTVMCLYLTKSGVVKLGGNPVPYAEAFKDGMKARHDKLNDPAPVKWEYNYKKNALHAMLMLADDSSSALQKRFDKIERSLRRFSAGNVLFTEVGTALRYKGMAREHFGYADGISQPTLMDERYRPVSEGVNVVFREDGGTYLVFRKLEQNVKLFYKKVAYIASRLNLSEEQVGAQIVGRFKDGAPLLSSQQNYPSNEFHYGKMDADSKGKRCPFHAHVRKSNPRQGGARILRRGITYGERQVDLSDQPRKGVGLLFMSFQKDIEQQFERIQRSWCDNEKFAGEGLARKVGVDPLIGHKTKTSQQWNLGWGGERKARLNFHYLRKKGLNGEVVKLKGGEYFYVPTISQISSYCTDRQNLHCLKDMLELLSASYDDPGKANLVHLKKSLIMLSYQQSASEGY